MIERFFFRARASYIRNLAPGYQAASNFCMYWDWHIDASKPRYDGGLLDYLARTADMLIAKHAPGKKPCESVEEKKIAEDQAA